MQLDIEVEVTTDCNVKCVSCNHFCDHVNEPWYLDICKYAQDLEKLKCYSIKEITLIGGEPLLHKDLITIMEMTSPITEKTLLFTNGLLLLRQKGDFWDSLERNNIILGVSVYPPMHYLFGLPDILHRMGWWGVNVFFMDQSFMHEHRFDLTKSQDAEWNYSVCGGKLNLREGVVYKCARVANAHYRGDLEVLPSDYRKIEDLDEDFINSPVPFCSQCVFNRNSGLPDDDPNRYWFLKPWK